MEVTLDDIARTLNASLVSLPGDPSRSMGYAGPTSQPLDQYRYHTQQLPGDFNRLNVGPPAPPRAPHSQYPRHPHYPAFGHPPPPPPPPPPRPGNREASVFRGPAPPIPPSLLTGPRNIERQLA